MPAPVERRQPVLFDNTPVKPSWDAILRFKGKPIGITRSLPEAAGFIDDLVGQPLSLLELIIRQIRAYEVSMAKDMSPKALYPPDAINCVISAFQRRDINHPLARGRVGVGRFFGAVVDYYAIYTGFANDQQELMDRREKTPFLTAHPLARSDKRLASTDELSGKKVAFIHGKFNGGFPHPQHIEAIENLAALKKDYPEIRVVVGVDAAYIHDVVDWPLVTPLFSCSTIALIPGVDHVCEMSGPYGITWRDSFAIPDPENYTLSYRRHKEDWANYYKQLYRALNVKFLHVRTDAGNPFAEEQLQRCREQNITPIRVERRGLPMSDQILRDQKREVIRWIDYEGGYAAWNDFEDEQEEMAGEIVHELIPQLEERRRTQRLSRGEVVAQDFGYLAGRL